MLCVWLSTHLDSKSWWDSSIASEWWISFQTPFTSTKTFKLGSAVKSCFQTEVIFLHASSNHSSTSISSTRRKIPQITSLRLISVQFAQLLGSKTTQASSPVPGMLPSTCGVWIARPLFGARSFQMSTLRASRLSSQTVTKVFQLSSHLVWINRLENFNKEQDRMARSSDASSRV